MERAIFSHPILRLTNRPVKNPCQVGAVTYRNLISHVMSTKDIPLDDASLSRFGEIIDAR